VLAGAVLTFFVSVMMIYLQTPTNTGTGMGLSVFAAGLLLLPFSMALPVGSWLGRRVAVQPDLLLPLGSMMALAVWTAFPLWSGRLWTIVAAMVFFGLAVGLTFAVTPRLVLRGVPSAESGSVLSLLMLLRYLGFTIGGALVSAALVGAVPAGGLFPLAEGFTTACRIGAALSIVAAVTTFVMGRRARLADPRVLG
jgi:MFS family permease